VLPPSVPHRRNCHSPQRNHYAPVGSANETNRLLLKNPLSSHDHANITSTAVVTAALKIRAIQKELIYKNADKASKLAPLETERFPTHGLRSYRVWEDQEPEPHTQCYVDYTRREVLLLIYWNERL
jgi:hypothetical protein